MSWLAPRHQDEFTGWIAGLGTHSGHRLVVVHWPGSLRQVRTACQDTCSEPAGRILLANAGS